MHPTALAHLRTAFQTHIDQGLFPGAVALIHHQGRTVLHEAWGRLGPQADAPAMAPDALFRIYSMTKPIASLVALMLMEEGRLLLSHPVSHYLPAFRTPQFVQAPDGSRSPATREATVHDLLRHTAGLSYAWDTGPVADLYRSARVGSRKHSNQELATAIAPLPLLHPPGTCWEYSRATDVLGAVIEAVEGAPLSAVLHQRVFGPLDMHETSFALPPGTGHRLAEPFARDPITGAGVLLNDVSAPARFESAGGGLVSTAPDYARFLQLLLGRGTLHTANGPVRLAGRSTVDFMTADHLGALPRAGTLLPEGYGFGLGVAVRLATGQATRPGSAGHYSWSGMGGTVFFVDPAEDLFAMVLTQAPGQLQYLCEWFPSLVYAGL